MLQHRDRHRDRAGRHWRGRLRAALGAVAVIAFTSPPALAHHAMGSATPRTALEGLLSGLAHPIIGLDHLAFVVGAGILAAGLRGGAVLPLFFLASMAGGSGLHAAGVGLPGAELGVAVSVLVMAALVLWRKPVPFAVAAAFFAVAGLLHGHALAESIVGAEPSPLVMYLVGLVAVQYAIALAALHAFQALAARPPVARWASMTAGAAALAIAVFALLGSGLPWA